MAGEALMGKKGRRGLCSWNKGRDREERGVGGKDAPCSLNVASARF